MAAAPKPPLDAHEWVSFEDPDRGSDLAHRRDLHVEPLAVHLRRRVPGRPDRADARSDGGLLLVRGALHRRGGRRARRGRRRDALQRAVAVPLPRAGGRPACSSATRKGSSTTRLVDGACIFLNRPGHPGGAGCALHRAAIDRGVPPLQLKPDVCWQLPLRREDTVAANGHVTSSLGEWKRSHWGEGGAEFSWWCTESPSAFQGRGTGLPLASRRARRHGRPTRSTTCSPPTCGPGKGEGYPCSRIPPFVIVPTARGAGQRPDYA